MSTAIPTVKPHRLKRSGKCPVLAFILMAILTPVGLGLGFMLAVWIVGLINVDFILLTIFLVWMGALMGASAGSAFGGHCRNMIAAFFAILPATILGLVLAVWIGTGDNPDFKNNAWSIIEALAIAGTPWFVLHTLASNTFCERCRKTYAENKTLWTSADHAYSAVVASLAGKAWNPPLLAGAKPDDKRDSVTIMADVCPGCSDAIVRATYKNAAGKKEHLVYSDFWPGDAFKSLLLKLGEKAG